MVLISGEKVFTKIITWRRNNGFHFSPKGKNGVQNAICAPGVKDTSIIPKFEPYLLKLEPNTQLSSLNTILVVSGWYDVTMTFYENFLNWQFVDIFAWKIFSCSKSRPLNTILMVSGRYDVIVTFCDNFVNFWLKILFDLKWSWMNLNDLSSF